MNTTSGHSLSPTQQNHNKKTGNSGKNKTTSIQHNLHTHSHLWSGKLANHKQNTKQDHCCRNEILKRGKKHNEKRQN